MNRSLKAARPGSLAMALWIAVSVPASGFYDMYCWQVYMLTTRGDRRVTGPGS
jgi:hypothetical protein